MSQQLFDRRCERLNGLSNEDYDRAAALAGVPLSAGRTPETTAAIVGILTPAELASFVGVDEEVE